MRIVNPPRVFILAGPNGAGKSTATPMLFGDRVPTERMINPDIIARTIQPDMPEAAARRAARSALALRRHFLKARQDFAYETTLSGRVAKDFSEMMAHGYEIDLWYLFLADPRDCLARVRQRVEEGGHDVPHLDVVRRHRRGLVNFDDIGRVMATRWRLIDSWTTGVIATGTSSSLEVANQSLWTEYEHTVRDMKAHTKTAHIEKRGGSHGRRA